MTAGARLWPIVYDDCPLPTPGPWLRLMVHPTLDDMRRLAQRCRPEQRHDEAAALFQPAAIRYRVNGDGSIRRTGNGYVGTMRLVADRVIPEIVAHECVHAAANLYRVLHDTGVDLGDDCGPDEEHFAFHLGSLVAQVSTALHDIGAWE